MQHFLTRAITVLLLTITALSFTGGASAQTRPYFARGTAQFTSPNDFVGAGHATHLGRYSEVGSVTFTLTSNPAVLAVSGATIYTAANSDELHATLCGTLDTATGIVVATVTYGGGTGRFLQASGAANLTGQMLGGGALRIAVAGTISY